MELNFIKCGDYYIPDIKLEKPNIRLGKWGRMRREYLRLAHPVTFSEMVLSETLYTENMSENILQSRLDKKQKICTFTHLSSRNRYAITVDNMPDISISVSSRLTFWEAFSQALQNE